MVTRPATAGAGASSVSGCTSSERRNFEEAGPAKVTLVEGLQPGSSLAGPSAGGCVIPSILRRVRAFSLLGVLTVAAGCSGASAVSLTEEGGAEGGGGDGGAKGKDSGGKDGSAADATSKDTGVSDTGAKDGAGRDAPAGPPTYCGPGLICSGSGTQQGNICCVSGGSSPKYACAAEECGCATQLDCDRPGDCAGQVCCIRLVMDSTCSSGHFVASCESKCEGGRVMCDPRGIKGCGAASCSGDTSSVGLPSGAGFGICR